MVEDDADPRDALPAGEHRLVHINVVQVAAARIRVVAYQYVAFGDVVAEVVEATFERRHHRSQVHRHRQPLRDQLPFAVKYGGGEIEAVLHVGGTRGAHDHDHHVIGDGDQRVVQKLAPDRVNFHGGLFLHCTRSM